MSGLHVLSGRTTRSKIPWLVAFVAQLASLGCQDNLTFVVGAGSETGANATCAPNLDGRIDADELPVVIGATSPYRVTSKLDVATVSTAGTTDAQGRRVWQWDAAAPADDVLHVGPRPLNGAWYHANFAEASFAVSFDRDQKLDAVYRRDNSTLWLLGYASHAAEPASERSLVRYDPPVPVLHLPLQVGDNWSAEAKISGATVNGLPYAGTVEYTVSVEAAGELVLPDLVFAPTLRVRTVVVNKPVVGASIATQQNSMFFECFGEVARIVAQGGAGTNAGADAAQGTVAGELWRYHP